MPDNRSSSDPAERARLGPLELIELGPTLARLGALASLRATRWATGSAVAGWRRVGTAVRRRESPDELLADARSELARAARQALGVTELEQALWRLSSDDGAEPEADEPGGEDALRGRGERLLRRSARFGADEGAHPAFGLVLEQLAPDEARILRVLWTEGAQPAVDVVESGPLGVGEAREVGRRLSILAESAGLREPDRLQLYLDNLLRLGLVNVDDDPLDEEPLYDLLEAQPEVSQAMEEAGGGTARAKVVRKRVELTSFGRSFCDRCLPSEDRRGSDG